MSITSKDYDTIVRPIITEKSTIISEFNQMVFEVPLSASKTDVKKAVENLFKVSVVNVNTLRQKGKSKRFRGIAGQRSDVKKAIVTLKDGDNIDISTGL